MELSLVVILLRITLAIRYLRGPNAGICSMLRNGYIRIKITKKSVLGFPRTEMQYWISNIG